MVDDVILNKLSIIKRCLSRIHEEYDNRPEHLKNFTRQDAIVLNLERACQASIDLAMYLVAERQLGLPQTSRDAFGLLKEAGILDDGLTDRMQAMVGIRNLVVHQYQDIRPEILQKVLDDHLQDFRDFSDVVWKASQ